MAGNVFVRCDKGIRVLNSSRTSASTTTPSWTRVASFERNERSATGDHFGWHPATGPDVDQREGHVFVSNLLVASERSASRCCASSRAGSWRGKLTQPQVTSSTATSTCAARPPVPRPSWSGARCRGSGMTECKTLAEFQKLCPAVRSPQPGGHEFLGALFQSPDLSRYELIQDISLPASAAPLPDEVRQRLGWQTGHDSARPTPPIPDR